VNFCGRFGAGIFELFIKLSAEVYSVFNLARLMNLLIMSHESFRVCIKTLEIILFCVTVDGA